MVVKIKNMQATSDNYVVEWRINKPKKKVRTKKIVISWTTLFKGFIPVLLYSWIYFSDFNLNIPIGKNLLVLRAGQPLSSTQEWSIGWPEEQYWEIEDELARKFIEQNSALVQSLELQNKIPAGVQMAIGLLNIQNLQDEAQLGGSSSSSSSSWINRRTLVRKWNNQAKAISHMFMEKGQMPGSREEWYRKVVEHFNHESEGTGFLVQNLIALYDLKKLDQQKS